MVKKTRTAPRSKIPSPSTSSTPPRRSSLLNPRRLSLAPPRQTHSNVTPAPRKTSSHSRRPSHGFSVPESITPFFMKDKKKEKDCKKLLFKKLPLISAKNCVWELKKMLVGAKFYGLPGTDGSFPSILYARLREEHIFLSTCLSHPLHPFSRRERLLWLWNSQCWLLMWSTIFTIIIPTKGDTTMVIVKSICVSVVSFPWDIGTRYALECSCLLGGGKLWGLSLKEAEEYGYSIMVALTVMSLGFLAVALWLSARLGAAFLPTWGASQLLMFFTDFVKHSTLAWFSFESDKEDFENIWLPYFRRAEMPASITEVAIKITERRRVRDIYPKWDNWFYTKIDDGCLKRYVHKLFKER
mmetsp:Transcript_19085/g.31103  ORF Transcript_19085/g.31103 Transcript_19085/m.31103 type:complete len:355 (-) Transcript_19085:23-1087(-)